MNILESELMWEKEAFLLLNGSDSKLLDAIMWLFSGSIIWLPVGVFFIFAVCYKKKWTEWLPLFLGIALVILLCDQFSSGFCKPFFGRLRPSHHPLFKEEVKILFGYRGGSHGFISSHAANFFGFATLTSLIFKHKVYAMAIFAWAFFVAYSRVYLGVHFISDVVVGALSGLAFGYLVYRLVRFLLFRLHQEESSQLKGRTSPAFSIVLVLIGNVLIFSIFSRDIVMLMEQ